MQSDEAVVKCILVFVMPLAVLCHLFATRVFFSELGVGSITQLPSLGLGLRSEDGLIFVQWSLWVNAPVTIFFIIRQWPRYFGDKLRGLRGANAGIQVMTLAQQLNRSLAQGGQAITGAAGKFAAAASSALPDSRIKVALGDELRSGMEGASSLAASMFSSLGASLKLTPRHDQGAPSTAALAVKYEDLVHMYEKVRPRALSNDPTGGLTMPSSSPPVCRLDVRQSSHIRHLTRQFSSPSAFRTPSCSPPMNAVHSELPSLL